ncbi:hypothetical protein FGADI_6270 [Fusarium gaditjirri]|uniref:Uncharacterized protein n=1 Tax=Fusarium gaditjirri TaxID=282569 RepID=A0A8H4WX02_9HYPO|nr:hypothetical protein FGADI_6270 [Fusarium gaditjirri]
MSSALTTTVHVISAAIYTVTRPTGSVIDMNPTATIIWLECPSHPKVNCNQNYTNTFVIGSWASTVIPEGLPSAGMFQWLWELEREAISYKCLMSSGLRETCTGLQIPLGKTTREPDHNWTRHSWTVTNTEEMLDTIQLPIVITSGQEQLGRDVRATPTEDTSKISASQKAATETLPPVTPTLFIYDADEYMIHTPTGSVISANPTAITIELGCPVQSDCPYEYSNAFVIGPWASTIVPEGLASKGTFHWYLANSYLRTVLSVERIMSSGIPQTCTSLRTEMETATWYTQDIYGGPVTENATNVARGRTLEGRFTRMPIVITAGQKLLESTATSSDIASSEETNAARSSAACVMGVVVMAVISSLLIG